MTQQVDGLRTEYEQVCGNFRTLTDIRFKLLAFLPIGTAAAAWLGSGVPSPLLSAFGLVVTLALMTYNERNNQLYSELVGRAAMIERRLGFLDGAFANRPGPWWRIGPFRWRVNHSLSVNLIYQASLSVWLFGCLSWLIPWLHRIPGPLPAVPVSWQPALALFVALGSVALGTVLVSGSMNRREGELRSLARDVAKLAAESGLSELRTAGSNGRSRFLDSCSRLGYVSADLAEARLDFYVGLDPSAARLYYPDHPPDMFAAHLVALVSDMPAGWIYDCLHSRRRKV